MGRHKISRTRHEAKEESESEEEDNQPTKLKMSYKMCEELHWLRMDLLRYINQNALPLCDHMDQNILNDFIEYLNE